MISQYPSNYDISNFKSKSGFLIENENKSIDFIQEEKKQGKELIVPKPKESILTSLFNNSLLELLLINPLSKFSS